ncbi:MAG TPA: HlyD family secretion protein [Hyphomicrobiaceae bacterium]
MTTDEIQAEISERKPGRRWLAPVLAVCAAIFVYNLIADRLTPYTSKATVQAYLIGIAPEVAGTVIDVGVVDNQRVKAGDVLFRIDPRRYEAALREAQAAVDRAGQSIGANTAGVAAAEAALTDARAQYANAREQATRIFELVKRGIYAKARGDQMQRLLEGAQAGVRQAEAQLEQARQQLGPKGESNPELQAALSALEQARLNLNDTVMVSPANGRVTNLRLIGGQFVAAGQPALTVIDTQAIWISANFRENNLGNMSQGNPAEIVLDVRPGEVFPGVVESIGWGVDVGETTAGSGLPVIRNPSGWLREAQRFPARVRFETDAYPRGIRYGAQANIIVYTTDNRVMNGLAWLWIRAVAWLSYLY